MDRRRALAAVRETLLSEAEHRREHDDWVQRERFAIVAEVNRQAQAHGWSTITVDQLERIEPLAVGHVDYADKLTLYACELSWGTRPDLTAIASPTPEAPR